MIKLAIFGVLIAISLVWTIEALLDKEMIVAALSGLILMASMFRFYENFEITNTN